MRKAVFAAVVGIVGFAAIADVVVTDGVLVADTPFDFEIGSTRYAKMLGDSLHSTASAQYDPKTKVVTTNWSWHADCELSKPYFGHGKAKLSFAGEDRRLKSVLLGDWGCPDDETMTVEECRKAMREIADDITRHTGVKMTSRRSMTDDEITEDLRKDALKGAKSSYGFETMYGESETNDVFVGCSIIGWVNYRRRCQVNLDIFFQSPFFVAEKDGE